MCATCVAEGVTYVGGAAGTLRYLAFRASRRRPTVTQRTGSDDGTPYATAASAGGGPNP